MYMSVRLIVYGRAKYLIELKKKNEKTVTVLYIITDTISSQDHIVHTRFPTLCDHYPPNVTEGRTTCNRMTTLCTIHRPT